MSLSLAQRNLQPPAEASGQRKAPVSAAASSPRSRNCRLSLKAFHFLAAAGTEPAASRQGTLWLRAPGPRQATRRQTGDKATRTLPPRQPQRLPAAAAWGGGRRLAVGSGRCPLEGAVARWKGPLTTGSGRWKWPLTIGSARWKWPLEVAVGCWKRLLTIGSGH